MPVTCPTCGGEGKLHGSDGYGTCRTCGGQGKVAGFFDLPGTASTESKGSSPNDVVEAIGNRVERMNKAIYKFFGRKED
jgi:hypothetical protein